MNSVTDTVKEILGTFQPVHLEEMVSISFMDRVDTKYILPVNLVPDLLHEMSVNYKVLEIDGNRLMNYTTIYYDTDDFLFFNQHVTGKPDRLKIRYRKYESTGTIFLEVKKKRKNRTIKRRIENNPDSNGFDEHAIEFIRKHFPLDFLNLRKVLSGSFSRITLANLSNAERITMDLSLTYSGNSDAKVEFPWLAVVEWKRDCHKNGSLFPEFVRKLSLHPTAFSKYCIGIASLYEVPKKNLLKPNFLQLKKIEDEYSVSVHA
ncbi:MAG: polyphosphate polymerase domain-containing protein [Bacteroidales bacterium]|nr:polyphosphate polymerase domain-containing protein [Bacteroidales bacterium]